MTDLDDRLRNWARVVRVYPDDDPRGQCASAEGHFRSSGEGSEDLDDQQPRAQRPADRLDAFNVEQGISTLHTKPQVILRLCYVWRLENKPQFLRAVNRRRVPEWGIRRWADLEAAMAGAMVDLDDALGTPLTIRRQRAVWRARQILLELSTEPWYRAFQYRRITEALGLPEMGGPRVSETLKPAA